MTKAAREQMENNYKFLEYVERNLDRFIENNYTPISFNVQKYCSYFNPDKETVDSVINKWQSLYDEVTSEDPEVQEGYSHLTKGQKTSLLKFIGSVLEVQNFTVVQDPPKKQYRRKRKRKEKPVEVLVKNIEVLQEDKELGIISCDPKDIVGKTFLLLYSPTKRKLQMYKAKKGLTFTVKGKSLLNYDEKVSAMKNVRKPEETLKEFEVGGVSNMETSFNKINAKNLSISGRILKDQLIFKVL